MPLVDALLPEFDHEMTTTRKVAGARAGRQVRLEAAREVVLARRAGHAPREPSDLGHRDADQVGNRSAGGATAGGRSPSKTELIATFDRNVAATRAA